MASQRGMKLPPPNYENVEMNVFEQRFEEFSKAKVQFVLYIDERFVKSHGKSHFLRKLRFRRFIIYFLSKT